MISTIPEELRQLLDSDGAIFLCLTEEGLPFETPPAALEASFGHVHYEAIPLELFGAESQLNLVTGFVKCLVESPTATSCKMLDGGTFRMHYFDVRESHACILGVLVPSDGHEPLWTDADEGLLPVRRCTSKQAVTGHGIWADEAYEQVLGYSIEEYVGGFSSIVVHPDDLERCQLEFVDLLGRPGGQSRIRMRLRHKAGHWIWIEITRTNLLHTDEPHIFNEIVDLSDEMAVQLELEERKALLAQLTESLPLGVLHLSSDGLVTLVNRRWIEMTGVEAPEDLESLVTDAFEGGDAVLETLREADSVGLDVNVPVRFTSPTDGPRSGLLRRQLVRTHADDLHANIARPDAGILLTLDDITETVDHRGELERLARTDHLTGTLNRLGLEEVIRSSLNENSIENPFHILYFDLDEFKKINDEHGHSAGDRVLQSAADVIRRSVRPDDTVGRVGGDEFVAVLRGIGASDAATIARRIQERVVASTGVRVAVGIATALAGEDFDALVARADEFMYLDKRQATTPST